MILTTGEKMVWAAAFAQFFERKLSSAVDVAGADNIPDDIILGCADRARVRAGVAVKAMREALTKMEQEDHEETQMLRAMLGDEG